MNEGQLAALLRDATAAAPPSRRVDLARAKADGDRARRRRLVGVSATAGATVLALLVGGGALVAGARPGPAAALPQATSAATTAVPVAPDFFDVRRRRIAAGWVPEGLSDYRFEWTRADRQVLSYLGPTSSDANGLGLPVREVEIAVYSAAVAVREPAGGSLTPIPALPTSTDEPGPAVGNAESWWNAAHGTLAWRWAEGGWATVRVRGDFDAPARELAGRIAAELRTDLDEPVRMPYTVDAPPAPLRLVETRVSWRGDGGYEGQLVFSDRDDELDPQTRIPRLLLIAVSSNDSLTGSAKVGPPNTNLDGHPAIVDFDANSGRVLLMGVRNCWVDVYVYDPATLTYVGKDAAIAMARGITVASSADPSAWTAVPIR